MLVIQLLDITKGITNLFSYRIPIGISFSFLALLEVEDVNVILVGWTNITQILLYPWVVEQSYSVAQYVGQLIDFLVQNGTPLKGIHIIGHSVGAHIAGVASTEVKSGIVGRITGNSYENSYYPMIRYDYFIK